MKRLPHANGRIVIALLASIVALPLSTTALLMSAPENQRTTMTEQTNAQSVSDRAKLRAEERRQWNAVEEFQRANAVKNNAVKPSADRDPADAADASSDGSDLSSVTTDSLTAAERAFLRTYTRAGSCPESLKLYPVGLYEMCIAIVGSGAADALPSGLLSHTAYLHRTLQKFAPDVPKMTLRLKMLQEALNGTKRDGGAVPGRPINCVNDPTCGR